MVSGIPSPARAVRLLLRDLSDGRQGVTDTDDLRVRPLETPGAGVRVADGSALIHGAHPWQGTYAQTNIGDAVVQVEPTGPFTRTDLLVLRIADPEHDGYHDPATHDIGTFHLVRDVDRDAAHPPAGMSSLPLARITLPRHTSTVTADMITDLRQVIAPRHQRLAHTTAVKELGQLQSEDGKWATWPDEAAWDVGVPTWAGRARIVVHIAGLRLSDGRIWAQLRPALGDRHGASTVVDDDQGHYTRRVTTMLADTLDLPEDHRGTRRRLTIQTRQDHDYGTGTLTVADGTVIAAEVDFLQEAP